MKKYYCQVVMAVLVTMGFFFVLGLAGDLDYTDQCILHMSQTEYDSIKNKLHELNGSEPSEREIAHYWADHHQ